MALKYRYHIRSTSLPSTCHPLTARVEEQLNKMIVELGSQYYTTDMLRDGLFGLKELYENVEDLLQLPHTQRILEKHRSDKWVDEVLERSLKLLDACGTSRDVLSEMKQTAQETRSALRRRRSGGELDLGKYYMSYRKKASKDIRKCLGELKRMGINHKHGFSSSSPSALLDQQHQRDIVAVVGVLRQVEAVAVSIYESLLSKFMFGSRSTVLGKPCSGWSLVSKLMIMNNKRLVLSASTEDQEQHMADDDEVKKVDVTLMHLLLRNRKWSCRDDEVAVVQNAQKHLDALEASIESLEDGLEWVFRQLIKTRVTLLNILNN